MNHSGNEHLSSGSPRAGLLTKDFVSNIWYTLYFSTGQGCWNTERSAGPDVGARGRKKVSAVDVGKRTQAIPQCKPLKIAAIPSLPPNPCICVLWFTYYSIRKWKRNITRGSLGALTRLVQHLRPSDKVCLYLTLPPLVFLLWFNLRAAPKPLLLFQTQPADTRF